MEIKNDTITVSTLIKIDVDIPEFKTTYLREGVNACADKFGFCRNTVVEVAKKLGISVGKGRRPSKV